MRNHVHLLVETPKDPISHIMHRINFTYTQYFNRKYGKVGHLFQGRYKSYLCDKDTYLLNLVRYIHLNPVRADIVKDAAGYQWSSHDDYVHGTNGLVDTDKVLRLFSERIGVARQKYMEFMTRGDSNTNPWPYAAYKQQIIGDERFVEKIEKRIENIEKRAKKIPIRDLRQAIEEEMGVGLPELISRRRGGRLRTARGIFVTLAKETGYKMVDIGRILKRDISVLSRLANISEMREGAKALQKVRMRLNA